MPRFAIILPMHEVAVLALPAVVAFDVSIPAQVFGHSDEACRYELRVCGPRRHVPTTTGFSLRVEHGLEALAGADTVIVPGYWPLDAPAGAVLDALRACAERGARMVSVCTGAFALAAAGLLDGRRAATHWGNSAELARRYPAVHVDPDVLYVADGPVLTSAGIAAGIDLCIEIIRRDHGADVANRAARRMVVAPHRSGGQAQFVHRPVRANASTLAPTCDWAIRRLSEPLLVDDLARHAGWAPRTFARRFRHETGTTPARWLTDQRVLEARRLLERTELPVDQVAARSGLGSAANLRVQLARATGLTPTQYRRAHYAR